MDSIGSTACAGHATTSSPTGWAAEAQETGSGLSQKAFDDLSTNQQNDTVSTTSPKRCSVVQLQKDRNEASYSVASTGPLKTDAKETLAEIERLINDELGRKVRALVTAFRAC
jgi:hypothetical protein